MSERFNIRDKCRVWHNVRDQQGVLELEGTSLQSPLTTWPDLLGMTNEGRVDHDFSRSDNEETGFGMDQARDCDRHWDNQRCRETDRPELYSDELYLTNDPLRESLFDDLTFFDECYPDEQAES